MKLANLLTVVAQVMQAMLALIMVLILAASLEDRQFVMVSLSLGTSQIIAILCYEWLRIGTMRWFPGPTEERVARLASIKAVAIFSTLLLGVAMLCLIPTDVAVMFFDPQYMVLITLISIFLGLGDLQLLLVRFSGEIAKSAILQLTRAVFLFIVPLTIALQSGDPILVLCGVLAAHVGSFFISVVVFPAIQSSRVRDAQLVTIGGVARQGVPAAVASQVHFLVSYMLRITSVAVLGADTASAAGFLLALDIVQKPFPILATLATALILPRLNKAFDENDNQGTRLALSQIYGVLGGGAFLGSFALICLLPAFSEFAVGEEVRPHFLEFANHLLIYFCLLLFVQSGVAVVLHLHKKTGLAMIYAAFHLATTYVAYQIWECYQLSWSSMLWMANGAIAATLIFSSLHANIWKSFAIKREVVLVIILSAALNLVLFLALPLLGKYLIAFLALSTFGVFGFILARHINLN